MGPLLGPNRRQGDYIDDLMSLAMVDSLEWDRPNMRQPDFLRIKVVVGGKCQARIILNGQGRMINALDPLGLTKSVAAAA